MAMRLFDYAIEQACKMAKIEMRVYHEAREKAHRKVKMSLLVKKIEQPPQKGGKLSKK